MADINPLYAAFMGSLGMPATLHAAQAFIRAKTNAPYLAFIGRARKSAPTHVHDGLRVVDCTAWQAHVEAQAASELSERFPTCEECGQLICGHSDFAWRGKA